MAKKKSQSGGSAGSPRIDNRKARHDFHIIEKLECGIELAGTEVKSLRAGQMRVDEAYVRLRNGQLWLVGAHVAEYAHAAGGMQHDPARDRRLLAHKRQIAQLESHVRQKGKTLVPLAVYFKKGWAKVEVGVAVGKRQHDKREDIKRRDQQREMQRVKQKYNR